MGPRKSKKILSDEFYISERFEYGRDKQYVRFNHPHLVDRDTFWRVQQVMQERSNNTNHPRTICHPDFPLRQFIRCSQCHKPLTGYWARGHKGKKFAYYECYNKQCGLKKSLRRDDVLVACISWRGVGVMLSRD
jgi:hypothetical protein